jgi:hypothetical protein
MQAPRERNVTYYPSFFFSHDVLLILGLMSALCAWDPFCELDIKGFNELTSSRTAAGEMLTAAQPHLERHIHPTVICRAFMRALDDAVTAVEKLAFKIDFDNREELLKVVDSCIATKFTRRFGTLIPVRFCCWLKGLELTASEVLQDPAKSSRSHLPTCITSITSISCPIQGPCVCTMNHACLTVLFMSGVETRFPITLCSDFQ